MSTPVEITFTGELPGDFATREGRIGLIVDERRGSLRRLPAQARAAAVRALNSPAWDKLKDGASLELAFPPALGAEALQLVKLPRRADVNAARRAGAAIGARMGRSHVTVISVGHPRAGEVALGLALRGYDFDTYKTKAAIGATDSGEDGEAPGSEMMPQAVSPTGQPQDAALDDAQATIAPTEPDEAAQPTEVEAPQPGRAAVTFVVNDPEALARTARAAAAVAEGVFFTRDLVNEPANVLTTTDFADRLKAMETLGLEVEVLEEDALAKLGMRALLGVGQGSESPSRVVVMRWNGGGEEAPLALVGKGVVFDTGGISIKPAAGMEEMTMDMGGAGVVAGVMRTLALRGARANVVGLVGLVENMPDGRAQRPGDIVRSMKGDTIEVINTDAEGRLVLADVLWYAQDRFKPSAVIDLATLTGAVIIALGHENAGVFSNDDRLADNLLAAARAEGEGAWRLPLGTSYDDLIKSRLADIKNTGGRPGGSITAAAFLQRFIRKGTPWAHIDIAGVALPPGETPLAPKGATGWGVMTLDRLIRDRYEQTEVTPSRASAAGGRAAATPR